MTLQHWFLNYDLIALGSAVMTFLHWGIEMRWNDIPKNKSHEVIIGYEYFFL